MKRAQLDVQILVLVTLALVAFGIVMVYSATSAAAAVGGANPNYFLGQPEFKTIIVKKIPAADAFPSVEAQACPLVKKS